MAPTTFVREHLQGARSAADALSFISRPSVRPLSMSSNRLGVVVHQQNGRIIVRRANGACLRIRFQQRGALRTGFD